TILTMAVSKSVETIHNRMPVILGRKDARRAWMQGEQDLGGLVSRCSGSRYRIRTLWGTIASTDIETDRFSYPFMCW
ncbi:MAG: SOS response-associated peptidase family protein, partial [Bacillota bacterium]